MKVRTTYFFPLKTTYTEGAKIEILHLANVIYVILMQKVYLKCDRFI